MFFEDNEKDEKTLVGLLGNKDEKSAFVKTVKMKNKIVNLFIEEQFTIEEATITLKRVSDCLERKANSLPIDSSFLG